MELKLDLNDRETKYDVIEEKKQLEFHIKNIIDRLELVQSMYQDQYDGIPAKRKWKKEQMIKSVVLVLVCLVGIYLCLPIFGVLGYIVLPLLVVFGIKLLFHAIEAFISYMVHSEKTKLKGYVSRYNIFTMEMEKAYCENRIGEIVRMKDEIRHMKPEQVEQYVKKGLNLNYIERRADEDVMEGYYRHKWLCRFIVLAIMFLYLVFVFYKLFL